jgi:sec-independent protein translocase protein TatC
MAFTFFFFAPITITALVEFMPEEMKLTINATSYLHFMLFFCVAIGGVFEMPLVIMILTKIGIITPEMLISKRKYAIILIWIAAAVITPTADILTQTLVAVPMMIIYEGCIIAAKIMLWRKHSTAEE